MRLRKIKKYCGKQGVIKPFRRNSLEPVEWQYYFDLCMARRPKVVLEIGCYIYASTCAFLCAMEFLPEMILYCVDPLQNRGRDHLHSFWPRNKKVGSRFFRIQACSQDWLTWTKEKFDICLIDGSHKNEHVKADFKLCKQHVNPGGTLLLHDWNSAGLRAAIHQIEDPSKIEWFNKHEDSHLHGVGIWNAPK